MSTKFIPYSSFLNDIYIPFYEKPKKMIDLKLTSSNIETDVNGMASIINLNIDQQKYIPFIDISKYDFTRKDWFYYNISGMPYRLTYNTSNWLASPVYGVPDINGYTDSLNISNKFNKNVNVELGLYLDVTNSADSDNTIQLYKGVPISVAIANAPLLDITNYNSPNIRPSLNIIKPNENREFYYDFDQNKLFTNQNLAGTDPINITIGFYITTNAVNIKCRLSANEISSSDVTPIVDYYIAKLSGQNLRG